VGIAQRFKEGHGPGQVGDGKIDENFSAHGFDDVLGLIQFDFLARPFGGFIITTNEFRSNGQENKTFSNNPA